MPPTTIIVHGSSGGEKPKAAKPKAKKAAAPKPEAETSTPEKSLAKSQVENAFAQAKALSLKRGAGAVPKAKAAPKSDSPSSPVSMSAKPSRLR